MKPSLQLNHSQQLTMTPQLQQAIRLLQLSTIDLKQEIQEALDSNPLLDVEEIADHAIPSDADVTETIDSNPQEQDSADLMEKSEISADLDMDATWDDIYSANTGSTGITSDDELPIYQGETTQSLQDYLLWQLELTPFSDIDHSIAIALIDAIDDDGYLTIELSDILNSFNHYDLELDEIEAVRKRIQQFDPLGVASLHLQDCLLLQLSTYPEDTPFLEEATLLLTKYIDLLGNRDYRIITKETKLNEEQLRKILSLIQQLDPKPGSRISNEHVEYVIPDVSVNKQHGKWIVTIDSNNIPKLKVNQHYASLTQGNSADNNYIRSHLQDAKWFIKSLESRNETLLKVTKYIVEHQKDFFEHGEEFMKPMVLNDVALAVDMHESTISRVTTQKYMHTPRGIFELKYFFSSHVNTDKGEECSSTVIRALIKKLVSNEDIAKPLSDNKIADLMAEQGIQVARRTIAKYRESLGIASSSQRKRLL